MSTRMQGALSLCTFYTIALFAIIAACFIFITPVQAETPPPVLTLGSAIERALQNAPEMAASASLEKAGRADLAQAGRWQNPELSIEAENILGNGDYKGADNAETTIGLTQPLELPSKRKHRLEAIARAADLGHQNSDITRMDVIRAATTAFITAAVAAKNEQLMAAQLDLATAQYKTVSAKVTAGKEPPMQERKAKIDLVNAQVMAQQAKQQATTARAQLDLITGMQEDLRLDPSGIDAIEAPLPIDRYLNRSDTHALLRAAEAEVQTATAQAAYAAVEWLPDPSVTFGVRDSREDDSQALVLGVSMPIPLADRNTSGIAAARERKSAAMSAKKKTEQTWRADIIRSHAEMTAAYHTLQSYRNDILPAATAAADLAARGYEAGKFQYIEMLDSRRTLAAARQAENDALLAYHLHRAELENLTGRHDTHTAETHQ